MTDITVPAWATYQGMKGQAHVVDVDANAMYPAILAEYKSMYSGDNARFQHESAAELDPDAPTAYWLEVAYQTAKLDLQRCCGFALNIHIHDTVKKYAQAKANAGRGARVAAGGIGGGKEARMHYVRLRGGMPQ